MALPRHICGCVRCKSRFGFGPLQTLLVFSEITTARIPATWFGTRPTAHSAPRLSSALRAPPLCRCAERTADLILRHGRCARVGASSNEHQRPSVAVAQPGGGDFCGAEEHSLGVGARSALRHHSGRGCPNAAPAGRVVSSAARPSGEHHRAVGAFSARPPQYEPAPGCAAATRAHTNAGTATTSATGRDPTVESPAPHRCRRVPSALRSD